MSRVTTHFLDARSFLLPMRSHPFSAVMLSANNFQESRRNSSPVSIGRWSSCPCEIADSLFTMFAFAARNPHVACVNRATSTPGRRKIGQPQQHASNRANRSFATTWLRHQLRSLLIYSIRACFPRNWWQMLETISWIGIYRSAVLLRLAAIQTGSNGIQRVAPGWMS